MLKSIALAAALTFCTISTQASEVKPITVTAKNFIASNEVVWATKTYQLPGDIKLNVLRENTGVEFVEPSITNLTHIQSAYDISAEDRFGLISEGQLVTKNLLQLVYGVEANNVSVGDTWIGDLKTGDGNATITDIVFKRGNKVYQGRVVFFVTESAGNFFVIYPVTK